MVLGPCGRSVPRDDGVGLAHVVEEWVLAHNVSLLAGELGVLARPLVLSEYRVQIGAIDTLLKLSSLRVHYHSGVNAGLGARGVGLDRGDVHLHDRLLGGGICFACFGVVVLFCLALL